jgi:zona occludens toxin (predicted ATPase)
MRIDGARLENALIYVDLVGILAIKKTRRNIFKIYKNINNGATHRNITI